MKNRNIIENANNVNIEIVIGDNSNLQISEAKVCVNALRPKFNEIQNKDVIIPKIIK